MIANISNSKKQGKLKASLEELVGPLLQQLGKCPEDIFVEKVRKSVEQKKNMIESRQKWDIKQISFFGEIERQIDCWNENKGGVSELSVSFKELLQKQGEEFSMVNNISDQLSACPSFSCSDNEILPSDGSVESQIDYCDENQVNISEEEVDLSMVTTESEQEKGNFSQKYTTLELGESSNSNNQENSCPVGLEEYTRDFDPQQKNCLNSLATFPENVKLKKRLLIYWWIGLGLVPSVQDNAYTGFTEMKQTAEEFFHCLVNDGILQPVEIKKKYYETINLYTIDPMIHRHLIYANKMERPVINKNTKGENTSLRIYCNDGSNARAILNLEEKYLNSNDTKKLLEGNNKSLQVVQLGRWHYTTEIEVEDDEKNISMRKKTQDHIEVDDTDFLKKLGGNVTFLSLQGISGIEELPNSIGKLGDLRILDLRACHNLEKLPQKRWSKLRQEKWFKSLAHLDISECYLLSDIPKWVCELSNLEVFKGFVARSGVKKNQFCRLRDLSKLKKLRKISVKISEHLDSEDAHGLQNLDLLSVLTVIWSINKESDEADGKKQNRENDHDNVRNYGGQGEHDNENEGNKVQTIYFPKNLQKLDIRGYPNAEAAEMLNPTVLPNLQKLYIRGGKLTKITNDSCWQVQILRLRFLKFFKIDWWELHNTFNKLEHVEYKECPRLVVLGCEAKCSYLAVK